MTSKPTWSNASGCSTTSVFSLASRKIPPPHPNPSPPEYRGEGFPDGLSVSGHSVPVGEALDDLSPGEPLPCRGRAVAVAPGIEDLEAPGARVIVDQGVRVGARACAIAMHDAVG